MSTSNTADIFHRRPRRIVLDCDVGIDDAWALLMLCKAETIAHPLDHRMVAITCVQGNTTVEQVAGNVAQVLHLVGRTDIPVFLGATTSLVYPPLSDSPPFHGQDGLGDVYPPLPDDHPARQCIQRGEHAVNALHRLAIEGQRSGQPITLVCLAPLTNIALAIRMYGRAFVGAVSELWLMGGNHLGIGNTPERIGSEYNFHADPEAAHIVLEAFGAASVPIFVLPWEATMGDALPIRASWRWEQLGTIEHPLIEWLNPIDRSIFDAIEMYELCDGLLAGCLLWPERLVERVRKHRCSVELQGVHTRGQMVVDRVNGKQSKLVENVWVLEKLRVEEAKELMLWVVDAASERWGGCLDGLEGR